MMLRSRRAFSDYLDLIGMSERQLARSAGLGHATVNHLMTGRRDTCSPRTAVAIERTLDCPTGLLFMVETEAERQTISAMLVSS